MMTEEKIQKLRRLVKRGEPEGEVREQLKREGYSKEDIDKVFVPHQYDMRSWYLAFGILISIAGVFVLINKGGLLVLALGGLLFLAYYRETERLKKG